jgi:hypothetical protein
MQMGGHPAQLDDDRGLHCVHALGDTSSELFGRKSDTCLASPQAADAKSRQRAPGQRAECLTAGLQGSYPSTHPLAMQNRPLKHARRVANGVRFVHEVARPSAGAAAPIGRSAASAGPRSRVSSALRQVRFDDGPPRSEPQAPSRTWGPVPAADGQCCPYPRCARVVTLRSMRIDQLISASSEPARSRTRSNEVVALTLAIVAIGRAGTHANQEGEPCP